MSIISCKIWEWQKKHKKPTKVITVTQNYFLDRYYQAKVYDTFSWNQNVCPCRWYIICALLYFDWHCHGSRNARVLIRQTRLVSCNKYFNLIKIRLLYLHPHTVTPPDVLQTSEYKFIWESNKSVRSNNLIFIH